MDIRLSNVKVFLPTATKALFHLPELVIPHGTRLLVRGRSGTGKTTLLHVLAGLMEPSEGFAFWGEKNLKYVSDDERAATRFREFGIVFQKLNLLEHLTALENVLLVLPGTAEAIAKARGALDKMGIARLASELAGNLSVGEQQRVAVARVLATAPRIILADEPTSSLDDDNSNAVIEALLALPNRPTIVVVSHDGRLSARFEKVMAFEEFLP